MFIREIVLLTLIFASFPVVSAITDHCDDLDLNPDISKSKFVYVNPNSSCDLSFNMPGLPSRSGEASSSGGGCGVFHEYASDALKQAENKLSDKIADISPEQAEILSQVMNSTFVSQQQNGAADAIGGSLGDLIKSGRYRSQSPNVEATVENNTIDALMESSALDPSIIRKTTVENTQRGLSGDVGSSTPKQVSQGGQQAEKSKKRQSSESAASFFK